MSTSVTPTTISRADHPIRLEMIDQDGLRVMRRLGEAGFSSYLVGGAVRDLYLGKTPKDFDIGTDAKPGQIRRLFKNSRTIGRRFRLVQVFFRNDKIIEVSTLRSLSEHDLDGPEQVLAPNNTYGTLAEDAQRRDLSINGLFYEIDQQTIIDYVGGVADLENGVIRMVGDPEKRILRDPVRMMRAIRHAARNSFTIEPASRRAIHRHADKLSLCPASRLRDELLKDLAGGSSAPWFELAVESGLFVELVPVYRAHLNSQSIDRKDHYRQIHQLLQALDRIGATLPGAPARTLPDHLILACLLAPWANNAFAVSAKPVKGNQLHKRAKLIREAINATIGAHLNLNRAHRQEITALLGNLPMLNLYRGERDWPKWLKRKSYFAATRVLYAIIQEAQTGRQVQPQQVTTISGAEDKTPPRRGRSSRGKSRTRPSFADTPQGGIFGFKKQ
jgi:poly(A) polymerase